MRLTGVKLVDEVAGKGAAPSISIPNSQTTVTITENDNARGLVQFDMTKVGGDWIIADVGVMCEVDFSMFAW